MSPSSRVITFVNVAHFLDHFAILIFPTAVLTMGEVFGADYGTRIAIATGSFIAFGALSLPAGWLGDRWSRRGMLAIFYFGIGLSLIAAGLAPSAVWMAVALTSVGCFAAIYHPVGTAMLVSVAGAKGRVLGWNGVFGNLGVAFAALVTGAIAQAYGWQAAFIGPGILCVMLGVAYLVLVPGTWGEAPAAAAKGARGFDGGNLRLVAVVLAVTVIAGGFTFTTATVALPRLVVERLPELADATALAGLLATAIYMGGAVTQVVVGRLIDRLAVGSIFVWLALGQVAGFAGVVILDGAGSLAAALLILAAVYGQVIVNDMLVAISVPDQWRGRAYAMRYVLGFTVSGLVVPLIAWLHQPQEGLTPVFLVMTVFALIVATAAIAYAVIAARRPAPAPA